MHLRLRVLIGVAAILLLAVNSYSRDLTASDDPLVKVENDYQSGAITLDQRAILSATAIRHPELLPAKYQVSTASTGSVVLPFRNATLALVEIRKNWDRLSPQTQATVTQMLTRWSTAFTYDTPGGFFKLHYDTTGTNAVPSTDGNANGIPDFIEKCAAYCDSTLAKHVALGYLTPPSDGGAGGDSKFDVYFEAMSYYGYAQPEALGPAPWNDATSYLVLHRNFLGFPANQDPEGSQYGAMKVTIAHEFHHCVQFAYDYSEYTWYMELDATYTEDVICPLTHDNYGYLGSFFSAPTTSLMDQTIHMYGSFVWGKYLSQKFNQSLMRAVWEGARYGATVYTTLSDTLQGRYGWSQDSAFADFAQWNFATSTRNDGLHHADAAHYPLATVAAVNTNYPIIGQGPSISPGGYAASYIQFLPAGKIGTLRVTFDGADSFQWAAWVDKSTTTNSHQFQQIPLTPGTWTGQSDVLNFQGYSSVTLIAVNLTEFGAAASFTYGAEIKSVYRVSSQVMTDSAVYAGATRQFVYRVYNNAPLGDVIRVTASDNLGWISMAPAEAFIDAGQFADFNVPVRPQAGIPLGTKANLVFRATSRSDTTVVDSIQTPAVTVLQIGDITNDGGVDIADMTALIAYLYLGAPPPDLISQTGNFDCVGNVDISDLTQLIGYLYLGGPHCQCNPF